MNDLSAAPAYFLTALIGLALWADIRHDLCRLVSGRNVVLLGIGAWYLLEAIMLPDGLSRYTQAQYNGGLFYVFLAFTAFLLGYHYTRGCSLLPAMGETITFFDDEKWLWRLVVIGAIIGFAPIVYFTGTQIGEMFEGMMGQRATWGGLLGRGRYGDARAFFLELENFIRGVAPFAGVLLFSRKSTLAQRLLCALVIGWLILRAYGSGTRGSMLLSVAVPISVLYWKATPALRKAIIYATVFCAPLIYGLMNAIGQSRSSGTFSWEARNETRGGWVGNEELRQLLLIISKVPAKVDYQYGYDYYVQLMLPIPRFLWPGKPTGGSGYVMAKMTGAVDARGEATETVDAGLIGEMYLEFGVIGIIGLSVLGGWLVKGWDQIPRSFAHSLPAMMYFSGGLGTLFILGRNANMTMFLGLLILSVLAWLIRYFNPQAVADANAVAAPPILHRAG
jgi:hypothetical protein